MVLTRKVVLNICSLTLHSNTEVLALPVRNKFRKLVGERLSYLQQKYKIS